MIERTVVVRNRAGLHTRPAAMIVKSAAQFKSDIYLESEDNTRINAKSIIGVMTLAAAQGTRLKLIVSGPDEEEAARTIAELFDTGFGEPL
ncbi:MAG: HPr family phosphocarrier protein [Chlorobi bacterium]|jgi:phosphocarrier protein|nr:HPr family phosphocarrier protein [Chlorobiota bacterium]